MRKIGMMQGRLTRPKGRGIQFFPFENWENEFYTAKRLGLDEIEFIFDYEKYSENPLWEQNTEKLKRVIDRSSIRVRSVCFDYFMRRAFYKRTGGERKALRDENATTIKRVLKSMACCGIGLIEIPLVDDSSLKTENEAKDFKDFLLEIIEGAPEGIRFGLETDLAPRQFKEYLDSMENVKIGANYDSGNSSGIGYFPYEEVTTLGGYVFNVHIKDRLYHGSTVRLGTGNADFKELFRGLKEIGYGGSFILQAARGEEGSEESEILSQMEFLRRWSKTLE